MTAAAPAIRPNCRRRPAARRRLAIAVAVDALEPRLVMAAVEASPYEQYMLELINRARADPAAEAGRLGVDLNEGLASGTISASAKQPLAMNPWLTGAARDHVTWLRVNGLFQHEGSGGSTPTQRMVASGYQTNGAWGTGEKPERRLRRRARRRRPPRRNELREPVRRRGLRWPRPPRQPAQRQLRGGRQRRRDRRLSLQRQRLAGRPHRPGFRLRQRQPVPHRRRVHRRAARRQLLLARRGPQGRRRHRPRRQRPELHHDH